MKHLKLALLSALLLGAAQSYAAPADSDVQVAQNRRPVRRYRPYVTPANPVDTRWAANHSPWDFSGLLGLYNPGFGVGVRAAYRFLNSVLENVDDSMSFETGLGYEGETDTYVGQSSTFTVIEIPLLARWDFRLNNTNFIVGANAGFTYLAGSSVTIANNTYTPRNGLYFVLGGQGMYRFNDHWAVRANIDIGGYTTFAFGATYFL